MNLASLRIISYRKRWRDSMKKSKSSFHAAIVAGRQWKSAVINCAYIAPFGRLAGELRKARKNKTIHVEDVIRITVRPDIFSKVVLAKCLVFRHFVSCSMATLKCFSIAGVKLWFWSNDRHPPHFHAFVKAFRERSTPATRLLIMNERQSADTLFTHLLDLQIRSPQRFYVADCSVSGETYYMAALLQRIASALKSNENADLILDARLEDGILHVISPDFTRLNVPIAKIPEFKNVESSKIQAFEIDEDGSFIYWPELDVHLGWAQLQQMVNPEAALKASQKSREFNKRHGRAVQKVREQAGLKPGGISGISGKQLQRIENGECRLPSNAIEVLSRSHKLAPNEYMKRLAEALD